jgi:hypothetical protein
MQDVSGDGYISIFRRLLIRVLACFLPLYITIIITTNIIPGVDPQSLSLRIIIIIKISIKICQHNDIQLLEDGRRVNYRNVVNINYTSDSRQCPVHYSYKKSTSITNCIKLWLIKIKLTKEWDNECVKMWKIERWKKEKRLQTDRIKIRWSLITVIVTVRVSQLRNVVA